jgi:hypothetical protein
MTTSDLHPNPLEIEPENTSGEHTEHNYRYQHAYGVILLIGATCNRHPYVAIYPEHHEDILCERIDKKFDGFQIKTRKPGEGDWDLNDEAVKKSIKRFTQLNKDFEEHICSLYFVSNADYSSPGMTIQDQTKLRRSPLRFMNAVRSCTCVEDIVKPFDETIQELRNHCSCTLDELFATLQKVWFINGPERYGIASQITDKHLPAIPECSSFPVPIVNAIREELIRKVWFAASEVEDPSKHWYPIGKVSPENPHITAKRIPVSVVLQTIREKTNPPFRYNGASTLSLGNGAGNLWRLQKKMKKGQLHSQIETMEQRSLSAEQQLIEFALTRSSEVDSYLKQLEWVVRGECDEAYLQASLTGTVYGPQMLVDVYSRLQKKAEQDCELVYRQPKELLIGIAGLLTGECKVWWSEPFDLDGAE